MNQLQNHLGIVNNKYVLDEKIGFGGTASVYRGHLSTNEDSIFAIKIPKAKTPYEPLFEKEATFMKELSHPNIINLIDFGKGTIEKDNLVSEEVSYIVMEYAQKGDLFDFVGYAGKPFTENHMRYIFKKILEGVQSMHKSGISHRDLKIENILVDRNYNPKVADFGFSQFSKGTDGKGLLKTRVSTPGFTAPEIISGKPYKGELADIFSLGVIMFVLIAGKMPFAKISKLDNLFRFIHREDYDGYWKRLTARNIKAEFSSEFKDLFQKMVTEKPEKRIDSIDKILEHPFFKKPYPSQHEIEQDFREREVQIEKQHFVKRNDIEQNTKEAIVYRAGGNEMSKYFEADTLCAIYKGKGMPKHSLILCGIVPYKFMNRVIGCIEKDESFEKTVKIDEKKMKFTIEVESMLNEEEEDNDDEDNESEGDEEEKEVEYELLKLQVVLKEINANEGKYLLMLKKKAGDLMEYSKLVDRLFTYINEKM